MGYGQILSAPALVRIGYGQQRAITIVAEGTTPVPANSQAYIYEGLFATSADYVDAGNGLATATIVLTNDNETQRPITLNEIIYSWWAGDIADDNREITIIYEAQRPQKNRPV